MGGYRPAADYRSKKEREDARAARRAMKVAKRELRRDAKLAAEPWRGHESATDPTAGMDRNGQFQSAWPDPPEPVAGVARTLSRGL